MNKFENIIQVRWSDVDQNRHVRHSAYYDYAAFTRVKIIAEAGFGSKELEEGNIGPILFKEECSFIREVKPEDKVRVNMLKGDMREDGSRWVIHHEMFNQNDVKVAHITVHGAWMDIEKRKLTNPPLQLAQIFTDLPKGDYYKR